MSETLYVVSYECYDAADEQIDCYKILGVADSVEKAKMIIEMEFVDSKESLNDYERHAEYDGLITYKTDDGPHELYYYIERFRMFCIPEHKLDPRD